MQDVNSLLGELRDFLYEEAPSERRRLAIYRLLTKHLEHQALWLPMFQGHARWGQEPLVWSHVEGMDGGALPSEVYGPRSVGVAAYDRVFPGAPLKILLRGGRKPELGDVAAPGALVRRCVHLCIDRPEWSLDGGQNDGAHSGSVEILDLLHAARGALEGELGALHTFTFKAAPSSRYDVIGDSKWMMRKAQTSLLPSTSGQERGFDSLKELLAGSPQLRRLTLSNKKALSRHARSGKSTPHCGWLPESAWWPELEVLDLHENQLRDGDLRWLFQRPMPALVELSLRGNQLTDGIADALLREGFFPALESLELRDNSISPEGAQALRESPHLPCLKTLLV